MSKQVGLDMYLYYNSGSYGSPTWALVSNCQDLKRPDEFAEAIVSRRAVPVEQVEPTIRKMQFEWSMVNDATDTAFAALKTRYLAKTLTELSLADGPIATTGTIYLRVETKLFQFGGDEPLDGAAIYNVLAKPCYSSNAPGYTTV